MSSITKTPPTLLQTINFACIKHRKQFRKADGSPYVNHPIGTALILEEAGVTDMTTLQAAVLHDTIEDTDTSYEELVEIFGKEVADIVNEVTDDKSLSKSERKYHQITHVPTISDKAKLVKLADKLYNCRDLLVLPPDWSVDRIRGYIVWSKAVLQGARGLNAKLDAAHDDLYRNGQITINGKNHPVFPDGCNEKIMLKEYLKLMNKL